MKKLLDIVKEYKIEFLSGNYYTTNSLEQPNTKEINKLLECLISESLKIPQVFELINNSESNNKIHYFCFYDGHGCFCPAVVIGGEAEYLIDLI